MNAASVIFSPLLPWPVLWAAAGVAGLLLAAAAWRGLKGWPLRGLAALALLTALAGPSLQTEERQPLRDILVAVVDESASQGLSDRRAQTEAALAGLRREAAAQGLDLRVTRVGDGEHNRGTLVMTALGRALADLPRNRVAAMVLISDGQVHDLGATPDLPAPLHLLETGHARDWDRRLAVTAAPAFAIVGEEQKITLRIDDLGAASGAETVPLEISVGAGAPSLHEVPVGRNLTLPITLRHGGANVIRLTTPAAEGELTDRNNSAVVSINGVRDRLSVLLVTGVPHPGTRTWRNLLKSDSAVDLVHFTILRPPEKQDGAPVSELSLIAFPTQELFLQKIDQFDLIIFDRYVLRGILPAAYLASVRDYVRRGGAVLVAAGPDFAGVGSLARSPLGDILPALPTSRVLDGPFTPAITDIGARHPVTRGLEDFAPAGGWGRWLRQVELAPTAGRGNVIMSGVDGSPLLVLDRVDEGRVALLGSDHAWLWSRGFEGGGPQLELLRRLAHWLMSEPELEEEALTATATDGKLTITRRSLSAGARDVVVTAPDGSETVLPMEESTPGVFSAEMAAPQIGLYRLREGEQTGVVAVGPATPKEFEATLATDRLLTPWIEASRGGARPIEEGLPRLRAVREGRAAAGRGWLGYTPRNAYLAVALRVTPLAPAWLMLLLAGGLMVSGWLIEGRRRRP